MGSAKNVFPEFAGPQIIILRNLLLPFSSNSLIAVTKASLRTPSCFRTSLAQVSHSPLQPLAYCPWAASLSISIRVFLDLSNFALSFVISYAVSNISGTTRGPRSTINSAISLFPLNFCSLAYANSSVRLLMSFWTINSDNQKMPCASSAVLFEIS